MKRISIGFPGYGRNDPQTQERERRERIGKLLEAISNILGMNFKGIVFEELFKIAYDLTLSGQDSILKLMNDVVALLQDHGTRVLLPRVSSVKDDDLLKKGVFETHKYYYLVSRMIRDCLMYPINNYRGDTDIPNLELEQKKIFAKVLCDRSVGPRVTDLLVDMTGSARSFEVDVNIVRSITSILFRVGPGDPYGPRALFERLFETPYLDNLRFYLQDLVSYSDRECRSCLESIEEFMKAEDKRASGYQTSDKLTVERAHTLCVKSLIENHMNEILTLRDGLPVMIEKELYGDLGRLYTLFKQVQNGVGLQRVLTEFEAFLKKSFSDLIDPLKDNMKPDQAVPTIEDIILVKTKCDKAIEMSFERDKSFIECLKKQLTVVMNIPKPSMARVLSRYADRKITDRGSSSQESALDLVIKNVKDLYTLLTDKDMFENCFKDDLRSRLLTSLKLQSVDTEKELIKGLENVCNKELITSCNKMITELEKADEINQEFMRDYSASLPLSLGVTVLSKKSDSWGFSCPTMLPKYLTGNLKKAFDAFVSFYGSKFDNTRKLIILPGFGNAQLATQFFGRKRLELYTTTAQMLILDLFNRVDSIAVDKILSTLSLHERTVHEALSPYIKGKMILQVSARTPGRLSRSDVLAVNPAFTTQKKKITTFKITHRSSVALSEEDKAQLEQQRGFEIEAAIVRVMKARRVFNHDRLYAEVYQVLSHRFNPPVDLFKKQISNLIEIQYLERGDERNTYRYIA